MGLGIRGSLGSTLIGIKGVPSDVFPVPGKVLDEHCGATGNTLSLLGGEGELAGRTERRSGDGSGEWEVGACVASVTLAGTGSGGWELPGPGITEGGWRRGVGDRKGSKRPDPTEYDVDAYTVDIVHDQFFSNKKIHHSVIGKMEGEKQG